MRRMLWVTGDVGWTDVVAIDKVMADWLHPGGVVVTGGAKGADTIAMKLAPAHQCFTVTVPYYGPGGRAGGPMRNQLITEFLASWSAENEVMVAAFGTGPGTRDSIKRAGVLGLTVHVTG